jgi:hypothetical protein
MHIAIFIFLSVGILGLLYWSVVRQSILDSIEDDVAALKNHISWQIIKEAEGSRSPSAQCLIDEVEASKFLCWISFSQIVVYLIQNRAKIKAEAEREAAVFAASPKWIKDARMFNSRLTIKAALANSPVWWLPLALILLCGLFSMSVANWWNDAGNSAAQLRSCHFGIRETV